MMDISDLTKWIKFHGMPDNLALAVQNAVDETLQWLELVGPEWGIDHLRDLREDAVFLSHLCREKTLHSQEVEAQILARRIERQIGQNVVRLESDGKMKIQGSTADLPQLKDWFAGGSTRHAIRFFAGVSESDFEAAMEEARGSKAAGLQTMIDFLQGKRPSQRRQRNLGSDKVLVEMLGQLEGVVAGLSMAHPQDVSPEVAAEYLQHVKANLREINRFNKELSLAHIGQARTNGDHPVGSGREDASFPLSAT